MKNILCLGNSRNEQQGLCVLTIKFGNKGRVTNSFSCLPYLCVIFNFKGVACLNAHVSNATKNTTPAAEVTNTSHCSWGTCGNRHHKIIRGTYLYLCFGAPSTLGVFFD